MSAETKAVDVLAVLDDHCKYCDLRMTDRHGIGPALIEARAAISDLIEAARKLDGLYQPDSVGHMKDEIPDAQGVFGVNDVMITLGDLRRLRSALARVQGGAK